MGTIGITESSKGRQAMLADPWQMLNHGETKGQFAYEVDTGSKTRNILVKRWQ